MQPHCRGKRERIVRSVLRGFFAAAESVTTRLTRNQNEAVSYEMKELKWKRTST